MGHTETVLLLLDRGSEINARGSRGWTPLHLAARSNRLETAQLLLARGAHRDARDDAELTPRQMAPRGSDVARLLGPAKSRDTRGGGSQ
jgi:ankyrin repeat protein